MDEQQDVDGTALEQGSGRPGLKKVATTNKVITKWGDAYDPDEWQADRLAANPTYALRPWSVDGVVRLGTTCICTGEPGTGKTSLWIAIGHAQERGDESFLGMKLLKGGTLLISQDTFRGDIIEISGTRAKSKIHVWPRLGLRVVEPVGNYGAVKNATSWSHIVHHCEVMNGRGQPVRNIVLDSLSALARVNLNDNVVASVTMDILRELAEETNTAVIVIHHPTKTNLLNGKSQSISGGQQLKANSDFIMELKGSNETRIDKTIQIQIPRARSADRVDTFHALYTWKDENGFPCMRWDLLEWTSSAKATPGVQDDLGRALGWLKDAGPRDMDEIGLFLWPSMKPKPAAQKAKELLEGWLKKAPKVGGTRKQQWVPKARQMDLVIEPVAEDMPPQ